MDKSIACHCIFYKFIVASLVIVVIVSGIFFFIYITIIRYIYAAVTQNIKMISTQHSSNNGKN